jgi:hypothetical protein
MLRAHQNQLEGFDQFTDATGSLAEERGNRFAAEKIRAAGRKRRRRPPRTVE